MKTKKLYGMILAATMCVAGMVAHADLDDSLVAPQASMVFYVHGYLNIVFPSNTTTTAYASFSGNTTEANFAYDVQTRPVGGSEWTAHSGSLSKYNSGKTTDFRDTSRFYWLGASTLGSSVEVRARIRITKSGDAKEGKWSEWSDLGTVEVLDEVDGTIINSSSSNIGKADDGDVNTFFESSAEPSWTGIDAESVVSVTRIRFTHRNYNYDTYKRGFGAVFEASDNADFSNAVQLYTVPNNYDPYVVNDVQLPTQVRARYFRVRAAAGKICNFTEVQWISESGCGAVLGDGVKVNREGEDDVFDYRAHVAVQGETGRMSSLRLLRGYSPSGPFEVVSETFSSPSNSLATVDDVSGVGMPCYYCWECTMNGGLVLTGAVSSVYIRPRQLERNAEDQTAFGTGVAQLPVNALFPGKTYNTGSGGAESNAFDGNTNSSPNKYIGSGSGITNPVIGVSLPVSAHLACVFVNADCSSTRTKRMKNLAFYGAADISALNDGEYDKLTEQITTYQNSDNQKWFRYVSTDTNSLHSCLFGYAPVGQEWCGHSREIRFVGWTKEDEMASGKVFAPEGVSLACNGMGVVTVSWTAAENATSISIERRQQGDSDWTLVAQNVNPASFSYTDDSTLHGGTIYEYRVGATGLGGMMSAEADPVFVEVTKPGLVIVVK